MTKIIFNGDSGLKIQVKQPNTFVASKFDKKFGYLRLACGLFIKIY